jgi:small nuclear ribonucleoprotein (snRNP)-like protein
MSTLPHSIAPQLPTPPPCTSKSPSLPSPSQTETISRLTSLLLVRLRITIPDNRTFIGTFICLDKGCNIILSATEEFQPAPTNADEEEVRGNREMYWPNVKGRWGGREVGMVLIPGREVVRVEVEESWEERGGEEGGRGLDIV